MKKFLLSAAALGLLALPAAAFAQDGEVTITGSVAAACVIEPTATITLGELADADGLYDASVADGETATLNAWCNGASSTIAVAATAITLQGGPAPVTGFTDTINFTATASVTPADAAAAVEVSDSTTGAADAAATVGLFSDDITVTLSASATDGSKLIAGDYEGSVTVTLAPAV